jgi:hypothetical protein
MNRQIKKYMMTIPAVAYKQSPPDSRQETRDVGEPVEFFCYVVDSVKVVMSKYGREEVSNFQMYVAGEDMAKLDASDLITCQHKVRQEPLKLDLFYKPVRGRMAESEVGVVYLR